MHFCINFAYFLSFLDLQSCIEALQVLETSYDDETWGKYNKKTCLPSLWKGNN